jgi:prepilin-type N-terminal cleavage/methylation domain-containing protein
MARIHNRPAARTGFTLIELLVVIAIIAILVSLTTAAVMKVLAKVPQTQTRTEIGQMDQALATFMADFGLQDPPPSTLVLTEVNPLSGPSAQVLKKIFGKNFAAGQTWIDWNGDGQQNGPWTLQGQDCLVFYLSGIPAGGNPQGFSSSQVNPAAFTPGVKTKGPYFNFNASRLQMDTNVGGGFMVYHDAYWNKQPSMSNVYAYFSTMGRVGGYNGGDCSNIGAHVYQNTNGSFPNANGYQIISPGRDGVFGGQMWDPTSGATGAGRDDQANFASGLLGSGQ